MNLTEKDITGPIARKLREELGLTQGAFWKPIGVKQSVGSRYEAEMKIPHAVRILLVANYISGMKIDTATQEGVAELSRLGSLQSKNNSAKAVVAKAIKSIETARDASQTI